MHLAEWTLLLFSRANFARVKAESETRHLRDELTRRAISSADADGGAWAVWSTVEGNSSRVAHIDRLELWAEPRPEDERSRAWDWRVLQQAASGEWHSIAAGVSRASCDEAQRMAEAIARVVLATPRPPDACRHAPEE